MVNDHNEIIPVYTKKTNTKVSEQDNMILNLPDGDFEAQRNPTTKPTVSRGWFLTSFCQSTRPTASYLILRTAIL